jgi:hypothetical protein
MLEEVQKIVVSSLGEVVAVVITIGIAAIKRGLEKRKLRRKGVLRDDEYFKDNIRHFDKWN